MVGRLEWRGNAAGVSFIVPNLPLVDYWLFMETHGQCWRVAGLVGRVPAPLVLSIGAMPADNQEAAKHWTVESLPLPIQSPQTNTSSNSPTPFFAIIGGIFMLTILILGLRLQRLRAQSSRN